MIVKMEIDLERGFAPWKEMFIDNEHKLNEHGGKLVFAGTEKDNDNKLTVIMDFESLESLQNFAGDEELTKIRGIGLWSAQMFLIFVLYRINIFSKGDLALMNSLKINYQIDIKNTDHVDKLIDKWSPYKTVASLILWKSIEEKYFYA